MNHLSTWPVVCSRTAGTSDSIRASKAIRFLFISLKLLKVNNNSYCSVFEEQTFRGLARRFSESVRRLFAVRVLLRAFASLNVVGGPGQMEEQVDAS